MAFVTERLTELIRQYEEEEGRSPCQSSISNALETLSANKRLENPSVTLSVNGLVYLSWVAAHEEHADNVLIRFKDGGFADLAGLVGDPTSPHGQEIRSVTDVPYLKLGDRVKGLELEPITGEWG
jgi:hypothetical protein